MGYLGNKPADSYLTLEKQTFTTSATDTYTLDRAVSGVNDIELFLNNVRQEPTEAYTISGTTLTLASAITSSDSMYCIYQGRSVGTQAPATGSVTNAMLAGSISPSKVSNLYPYRNLIINGDMSIAQRGTSATSIDSSNQGYLTLDRWLHIQQADDANTGKTSMSQSTDVPSGQGFANSLKINCTTAQTSISGTNSRVTVEQRFEGQMLQYLKKGTANAESLTLSFWVKSNKTGTYICALRDIDNTRQIAKSYTISSADTWEKKTIIYDGDTTGSFDNNNARSLDVIWGLATGSDYSSGTLQTTWGATVNSNTLVGQVNLMDSTSNYINITGVQLEVGTSASNFEFLPYDVNINRCERYYQKSYQYSDTAGTDTFTGQVSVIEGNAAACGGWTLKNEMRTAPTVTLYSKNGTSGAVNQFDDGGTKTGMSAGNISTKGWRYAGGTVTAYRSHQYHYIADAEL